MVFKSSLNQNGGGGVAGVSSLQGETGAITLTSSGGTVAITTPSSTTINLEASAGAGAVTTTGSPASGNLTKFSGATSITNGDLSGDVTTSGTLVANVGKINGAQLSTTTPTAANILIGSGSAWVTQTMTGDVTVNTVGLTAIGAGKVTSTMLAGAIAPSKLSLTDAHLFVGNSSNVAADVAMVGDATLTNNGTITLATVNSNVGTFGSSASIPVMTVNGKGLITAVSTTSLSALTTTLTNAHIFVGNSSNIATDVAMVGDATLTANGSITLATVNSNIGSYGSNVSIPTFTTNAKGLITAVGTTNIAASASALIGTTIGSTVVNSFLTQIGTLATGTWHATTIDVPYGGTGLTSLTANAVLLGRATASISVATIGTAGRALLDQGAATDPSFRAIVGDATLTANGSLTLATVNSNIGSFGSSSSIPTFTVNAKGLITAAGTTSLSSSTTNYFGSLVYANTSVPAGNTITSTSETAFDSSYTIPAGSLNAGDVVRVKLYGVYSGTVLPTIRGKVKFGSTTMLDTTAITGLAVSANFGWWAEGLFVCDTNGASGAIEAQGYVEFATAATTGLSVNTPNAATVTVDTTASQAITVTIQWGAGGTGQTITLREMAVEVLRTNSGLANTVQNGGTGNTTLTAHAVLLGEGTSAIGFATVGTSGRLLVDQGSSSDPAFATAPNIIFSSSKLYAPDLVSYSNAGGV